jgi:predicted GH43/DUF377 family glycosyl hydrolase
MRYFSGAFVLIFVLLTLSSLNAEDVRRVIPGQSEKKAVSNAVMQNIYEQVKTPFKYGVVFKGQAGKKIDCPSIFRMDEKWYMVYIIFDGDGYETAIARSDDLVNWQHMGAVMSKGKGTWDANQVAAYVALQDPTWGGSYALQPFENKYWFSYLGGALTGYETDPLAIGMAWTEEPTKAQEWQRLEEPVLTPAQTDVRHWEGLTQYKSNIIWDKDKSLGYPFVMFYNAKTESGYERIGMAVSDDMKFWRRYGVEPVIDNGRGLSGDPQVVRIGDVWVMFYFGAFFKPKAFDTFACSYDLVHWTKWEGAHLVEPSEKWDETYAHKPYMIFHDGIVYHFYCAVGDEGRVIALATSKDLQSNSNENKAIEK